MYMYFALKTATMNPSPYVKSHWYFKKTKLPFGPLGAFVKWLLSYTANAFPSATGVAKFKHS